MRSQQLFTLFFSSLALAQQSPSSSSSSSSSTGALYPEYGVLEFDNFGFEGYYKNVKELDDSSSCACEMADNSDRTLFSGPNSPLDKGVSVHFRGPLILNTFAFYDSDGSTTSEWNRAAYYDGSSKENVTFLTAAGDNSVCLGDALTYADSDGISKASSDTLLANNTLIASDDEFILFSNVSCEKSGFSKDCGVYRDGIPAYHGFEGVTKLFLFEFQMPEETSDDESSFEYYNMPAIWLLNDHIPRTSQYPTNANCSCWATGCGEFDIFEVMNTTESTHLYSTLHDYQGTGDIGTGIQARGYIERQTDSVMKGGVVFSADGKVTVFMSDEITFSGNLTASDVTSWISDTTEDEEAATNVLVSATNTGSGEVNAASPSLSFNLDVRYIFAVFAIVGSSLFF
jgi:hypothetical protein